VDRGVTPRKRWLLTWSLKGIETTVAGEPPHSDVGMSVSDAEDQDDNGSHECNNSGGMKPCRGKGEEPRGGAVFDENGPNVTEEVGRVIGTTLVRSDGPEDVQSSGIESNTGERSEIISLWRRAATVHALAKVTDSNTDRGPVLKVRESVAQLIVGLVLHNQGSPSMIRADR